MTITSGYVNHSMWVTFGKSNQKNGSYEPVLTRDEDTNDIQINFVQVPPEDLRENIFSEAAEAEEGKSPEEDSGVKTDKEKRPTFGPKPDFESNDFNFPRRVRKTSIHTKCRGSTSNR